MRFAVLSSRSAERGAGTVAHGAELFLRAPAARAPATSHTFTFTEAPLVTFAWAQKPRRTRRDRLRHRRSTARARGRYGRRHAVRQMPGPPPSSTASPAASGPPPAASTSGRPHPAPSRSGSPPASGSARAASTPVSLAEYTTEGPDWPTSGHQTLVDKATVYLTAADVADAGDPDRAWQKLSVKSPDCYGQIDLYGDDVTYDGGTGEGHGPAPHQPSGVNTPYHLIAAWNGGDKACAPEKPTPTPSQPAPSTPATPHHARAEHPSRGDDPAGHPGHPDHAQDLQDTAHDPGRTSADVDPAGRAAAVPPATARLRWPRRAPAHQSA
ncbi:hypothetical protein GCM10020256_07280 [Streptomyces thermocoprophilus]